MTGTFAHFDDPQPNASELDESDLRLALDNRVAALASLAEQMRDMAREHEDLVGVREEARQARTLLEGYRRQVEESEHHRRMAEHALGVDRHQWQTRQWELETELASLREALYHMEQRAILAEQQPLRLRWSQMVENLKERLLRR